MEGGGKVSGSILPGVRDSTKVPAPIARPISTPRSAGCTPLVPRAARTESGDPSARGGLAPMAPRLALFALLAVVAAVGCRAAGPHALDRPEPLAARPTVPVDDLIAR